MKKTINLFLCIALLATMVQSVHAQNINTIAGTGAGGYSGDGGPALSAHIENPVDVALASNHRYYICVDNTCNIRLVDSFGNITTVAGSGTPGFSGDGGPATAARLYNPTGIVTDALGNLYIADANNHVVRKVSTAGIITTFAGTGGVAGHAGDGGAATSATMRTPIDITFDRYGNMYIAEADNHLIRKIDAAGIISTIAGTGAAGFSGDGGAATAAKFNYPTGVSCDSSGNLYVADQNNNRVRKITTAGIITTVAGTGTAGFSGDAGAATAAMINRPTGVEVCFNGNLLISGSYRVRMVDVAGIITTVAGTGSSAFSGDGGPATAAGVMAYRISADPAGIVYVSGQSHNRVRTFPIGCPLPDVSISGPDTVCKCEKINLSFSGTGGTWSTSNNNAFLAINGSVIGFSIGYDTISYIATNACGSDTAYKVVYVSACGTEGVRVRVVSTEGNVTIFPNPASDILTVRCPTTIFHVSVTDLLGQELVAQNYSSKEVTVNINDLPSGMYIVKVNDIYANRVIKE